MLPIAEFDWVKVSPCAFMNLASLLICDVSVCIAAISVEIYRIFLKRPFQVVVLKYKTQLGDTRLGKKFAVR